MFTQVKPFKNMNPQQQRSPHSVKDHQLFPAASSSRRRLPPGSPHSDTAAHQQSSNVPQGQQQHQRPLSVPPQSSEHSYAREGVRKSEPDIHRGTGDDFILNSRRFHQSQQQQQQQTIAEVEEMDDSKMLLDPTDVDNNNGGDAEDAIAALDEVAAPNSNNSKSATTMPMSMGTAGVVAAENSPVPPQQPLSHQPLTNLSSVGGFADLGDESQSPSKVFERRGDEEQQPQSQQKTVEQKEEEQQREQLARQRRREPVVLDCRSLERAMQKPAADEPSPLEHFLLGQTLLARLLPFFELAERNAQRRERGSLNLPIRELQWAQGVLTVTFPSYAVPSINASGSSSSSGTAPDPSNMPPHQPHQCIVRMQLLVCPKEFRLVAKLEYSGSNCPNESDVRVFERFFAHQVVRMNNEMAVFSFVSMCRLCSPQIYASLAQMMLAQMEPQQRPWRFELELLHMADEKGSPAGAQGAQKGGQQKVARPSIQVTEPWSKQLLFIIHLRPTNPDRGGTTTAESSRRIFLRYGVERNELGLYPPSQQLGEVEQRISSVLEAQTELVNREQQQQQQSMAMADGQQQPAAASTAVCSIWPCICAILEGKHQQQQPQSAS